MAKTNTNTGLDDIRGRISKWVYKTVNGKTVIAARPKKSDRPPTDAQAQQRVAFRTAAAYARTIIADPVRYAIYSAVSKLKKVPIFALAVGDFFNPPTIDEIDLFNYHGKVGDVVRILATDDVHVMSVQVFIRDMSGLVLEQGMAAEINKEWIYTAMTLVPTGTSVTIEVAARDRPNHEGKKEVTHVIA